MKSELAQQLEVLTEAMAGPATRRRVKAAAPLGALAATAGVPEVPRVVAGKGAAAAPAALKAPPPLPPRAKARPEAPSTNAAASASRVIVAKEPAVVHEPLVAKDDPAPAGARAEVTLVSKNDARRETLAPTNPPRPLVSSRPPVALPRKLTADALAEAPWASTLGWFTGADNAGEPAPEPFTALTAETLQEEPWGAFLSYLAQPALPASEVLDELVFPDDDGWDLVLNKK